MNFHKIIIFTIVFLWHSLAGAQVITGIVCDKITKLPVSDVYVYLNGTSISTFTNISGRFELKTKSVINTKLVLYHLSHETVIINNPFDGIDTLYLEERVKTIREVTISAARFTREQKMKAFREQFLGMSRAGRSCIIVNEDDIELTTHFNRLLASSDKPIEVMNHYLGYKISIILVDCFVQYAANGPVIFSLDSDYAQSSFFAVILLFTDLYPDSRRMKRRRDNVYENSSNYFFKSWVNDDLKDNGFILFNRGLSFNYRQYFSIKDTLSQKMISIIPSMEHSRDTVIQPVSNFPDTLKRNGKTIFILPNNDTLMRKQTMMSVVPTIPSASGLDKGEGTFYTGPKLSGKISVLYRRKIQSDIYFMTDTFMVDLYGNIRPINKIAYNGQMGENRVGDMLPIDYELTVASAETKQMTLIFHGSGLKAIYLSGTGTVTIDWGDGSPSQTGSLVPFNESEWGNLNTMYKYGVKNDYSKISTYTITITGTNITHLNCMSHEGSNRFTSLDVSKNNDLKVLWCMFNQLTSLDISKNTELISLQCMYNQLTKLDVSNNIKLTELSCFANPLTTMNFKKNAALTKLACGGNLSSLDVSGAIALTELNCIKNPLLQKLDLSKNTKLNRLTCTSNQLTSLKLGKNDELTLFQCDSNQLSAEMLNTLFEYLNSNSVLKEKTISIGNNPGTDTCNKSIATDKEWKVIIE